MFAEFFQDVFRMLRWVLCASWNESMGFDDPKVYGDTSITDGLVFARCSLLRQPNAGEPRCPPGALKSTSVLASIGRGRTPAPGALSLG